MESVTEEDWRGAPALQETPVTSAICEPANGAHLEDGTQEVPGMLCFMMVMCAVLCCMLVLAVPCWAFCAVRCWLCCAVLAVLCWAADCVLPVVKLLEDAASCVKVLTLGSHAVYLVP